MTNPQESSGYICKNYVGQDAIERLDQISGLRPTPFIKSLGEAIAHAAQVTTHHPKGSFGTQLYEWWIATFRNEVIPEGWYVDRPDNLETTVHPHKLIQIAYSRGTEGTGIPDMTPSTFSEKGRATATVVSVNQYSFPLPGFEPVVDQVEIPTYLFLVWIDEDTLEYRCELSLPSSLSSDHHVQRWVERIHIPLGTMITDPARKRGDNDDNGEVVIQVKRIAG